MHKRKLFLKKKEFNIYSTITKITVDFFIRKTEFFSIQTFQKASIDFKEYLEATITCREL